ncbi:MAG TPA: hypothetical protein VJ998_12605 [Pseudomonadales bacterium]|nr:hypothetical protein [Pseudomonadales bacterium]
MSELNDLSKDERDRLLEKARTSLAQRRPGFGVRSFAIGLGIPAITLVTLMTAAPAWRTATLWHRLIFIALVAVATRIGVIAASRTLWQRHIPWSWAARSVTAYSTFHISW